MRRADPGAQVRRPSLPCRIMRASEGWTVVEVALVTGMVMFGTALSVPTLSRNLQQFRLDSATYSVSGDLQLVRIQALKHNSSRTMTIHAVNGSWDIEGTGTRFLARPIIFGNSTAASVTFDYRGRSTATGPLTITLSCSHNATRIITIHPSGRIAIH